MSRKYKELITLGCADKCVTMIGGDDLSRRENQCLQNCFHKYYRYLAYSNTLYTYLTADAETSKMIEESVNGEEDDENSDEMERMRQMQELSR